MKRINAKYICFLLLTTLALLALAACDNEDAINGNASEQNVEADYIAQPYEEDDFVFIPVEPDPDSALYELLSIAHLRREGVIKPDYNEIIEAFRDRAPGTIPLGLREQRQSATVSAAEAIEDISTFFEVIRNFYVGYIHFGGDEVFLPIRDAALAEVHDRGGEFTSGDLGEIIRRHVSTAIVDAHFLIGSGTFGIDVLISRITVLYYYRTGDSFVNRETGLNLVSIAGHDIEQVMRLYTNDAGDVFYRPLFEADVVFIDPIDFTYSDGSVISRQFEMYRVPRPSAPSSPRLSYRYGIPIVNVSQFGFDGHENALNRDQALAFLSFAHELRSEPALIVDLRNNFGGNGLLPIRWLKILTGEVVPTNYVTLLWPQNYVIEDDMIDMIDFDYNPFANPPGAYEYYWGVEFHNDGLNVAGTHPDRIIENERVIIFLTNRNTASAGESFVDLTINMSNTLVIGSSTRGILAFGGAALPLFLPNSGLMFGFGETMHTWPEGHFAEGYGIRPDVWVEGDALAAALALLRDAGFGY